MFLLLVPIVFALLGLMGLHFVHVFFYHSVHVATLLVEVLIAVLAYKIALNEYRRRRGDGGSKL